MVLKSYRNMPPILVDMAYSFFFMPVLDEAQMNHTNDPGPVLQRCTEINIRNGDIGQIDENRNPIFTLGYYVLMHRHTHIHALAYTAHRP